MPIQETPITYRTSDGREFKDKREAERHEVLVVAAREYEDAQRRFGVALAETQRTADGHLFSFTGGPWHYHYITRAWGRPELREVSFYARQCRFSTDEGEFKIWHHPDTRANPTEYYISELYAGRAAAELALLAAQEKWLAEEAEAVAKLRARIAPAPMEREEGGSG